MSAHSAIFLALFVPYKVCLIRQSDVSHRVTHPSLAWGSVTDTSYDIVHSFLHCLTSVNIQRSREVAKDALARAAPAENGAPGLLGQDASGKRSRREWKDLGLRACRGFVSGWGGYDSNDVYVVWPFETVETLQYSSIQTRKLRRAYLPFGTLNSLGNAQAAYL